MPISRPRGIGAHDAAGGGHRDLRRPAAAEARHARLEGGLGQLDLRTDAGIVFIDGEAAAGPGDAVILRQRRTLGQA